ncbi:MAG: arginase family protein [Anaerolineales bacterium]|nr:arginase family protein [Anaerolineales bacterium]
MENHFILTPYFLDEFTPGLETLAQPGWQINKPELPEGNKQARMGALYQPLAQAVAEVALRGERPVSIAGDCCTAIGVLAGLQRAGVDPLLIWFDAHGDFNTWETTPSGFLGGMPLAMLVGRGEQTIAEAVGLRPLPEAQVVLADARDLDAGERLALEASGVTRLPDARDLLDYPLEDRPIYVHFDTDTLDPTDAPAMNYLAPGGPSADELREVFRFLAATGRVVAVSLSSWNPELDEDGRSREVCMGLMDILIG